MPPKVSHNMAVADCKKCGHKHHRLDGVRCRRQLNISAPIPDLHAENIGDSLSSNTSPTQQAVAAAQVLQSATPSTTHSHANYAYSGDKLDHLLKKIKI